MIFNNATHAFESLYKKITHKGNDYAGTKAVFNQSFTLLHPKDKIITTEARKFKQDYAEYEWKWYLNGDRSAKEIAEKAKIWYNMIVPNTDSEVNSNYGYFWNYDNQLDRMIEELKANKQTRRAILVHYDIHELDRYKYDTPCNVVLNFYVYENQLNLTIFARSIDLWYGFGNDQYTFAKLMELVSEKVDVEVGSMHWFITNLHVYNNFLNKL